MTTPNDETADLPWTLPPELAPYMEHVLYGDRAEELMNRKDTFFANAPVAVMRAEMTAQMLLLARLHSAGLLKDVQP